MQQDADFITADFLYMFRASWAHHQEYVEKVCGNKICILLHHVGVLFNLTSIKFRGTAVAQWLRCCGKNRKVAGSIPVDVTGIFH